MFKIEEKVKVKLTDEIGMVLEIFTNVSKSGTQTGYQIRLANYGFVNLFEFELEKVDDDK